MQFCFFVLGDNFDANDLHEIIIVQFSRVTNVDIFFSYLMFVCIDSLLFYQSPVLKINK